MPEYSSVPLHTIIRNRREELNLRQGDIARVLNVNSSAVTLWEAGSRRMELSKIPRLAEVLQLDARELCLAALQEFHPVFYDTLFGTSNTSSGVIEPAA